MDRLVRTIFVRNYAYNPKVVLNDNEIADLQLMKFQLNLRIQI